MTSLQYVLEMVRLQYVVQNGTNKKEFSQSWVIYMGLNSKVLLCQNDSILYSVCWKQLNGLGGKLVRMSCKG